MKIGALGTTYWPQHLQEEGFFGEVELRHYGLIVLVIKPFATKQQIVKSLELALEHEKLNAKAEEKQRGVQQK
jgi:hypothetical protein